VGYSTPLLQEYYTTFERLCQGVFEKKLKILGKYFFEKAPKNA